MKNFKFVAWMMTLVLLFTVTYSSSAPVTPNHYQVEPGETYRSIALKFGLDEKTLACANAYLSVCPLSPNQMNSLVTSNLSDGRIIHLTSVVVVPTTTTSSTSVPASSTTSVTTTNVPDSTTTLVPTSTSTTTTSTTVPSTTLPQGDGFTEDFSVNGTEQLNMNLYRRDNVLVAQTQWQGDHNMACGHPDTRRLISRTQGLSGDVYRCAAEGQDPHLMVSEGDTSGYTILWLSPKKVFSNVRSVCVDMNLNFGTLGYRQWPSIAVMPVNHTELTANVPASDAGAGVAIYPPAQGFAVADIGSPNGATGKLQINGQRQDWPEIDAKGDAATRYPVCFIDNKNGTLTLKVTGPEKTSGTVVQASTTRPGSFPSGQVKVVIAFHGYTPLKAQSETGVPVTRNTWHVDNIKVVS